MSTLRKLVILYAAALSLLVVWAWTVDIVLADSQAEHLLPGIMLALASLPTSLLLAICRESNSYCGGSWGQLALLTLCGIAQAAVLVLATHWVERRKFRRCGRTG